jgi:HSP20 family protein
MTLRVITPSGNGGVRSVLPVNPFGFLQREIDRLFENFTGGSEAAGQAQVTLVPSMDVIETETEILIAAEMPGLQRDDVQITIADDVLTIRGEKRPERKEEGDKDKRYQVSERSYGVFLRSLQLPAGVDPSSVEATMSNGVLRIRIPKPAHSQPKKIEVKDAAPQREGNGQQRREAQSSQQNQQR